jgi:hypothetical protein
LSGSICVVPAIVEFSFSFARSGICRSYGAASFVNAGFYKDVAPDGDSLLEIGKKVAPFPA